MIPAPLLEEVLATHLHRPRSLCCILLTPPFTKVGKEGVIPRLDYLNYRSGSNIHFYCAGYGGNWCCRDFPDMEFVANGRLKDGTAVPWAFSQKVFAQFTDELESKTTWKYSGEAEIIVLSPEVDFSDCIIFDIEKMIKDRAIDRISELFESLIQYARLEVSSQGAHGYSEARAPRIFGDAVLGALLEGPKALGKTWKEGRHYATRNLHK